MDWQFSNQLQNVCVCVFTCPCTSLFVCIYTRCRLSWLIYIVKNLYIVKNSLPIFMMKWLRTLGWDLTIWKFWNNCNRIEEEYLLPHDSGIKSSLRTSHVTEDHHCLSISQVRLDLRWGTQKFYHSQVWSFGTRRDWISPKLLTEVAQETETDRGHHFD